MSEDPQNFEIIKYRLDSVESRQIAFEHKFELLMEKLEQIRKEAGASKCPGTCNLLQVQITNVSETLKTTTENNNAALLRLNTKMDTQEARINQVSNDAFAKVLNDIKNLQQWRWWLIGISLPILGLLSAFADEIKLIIFKHP
jgi:hypothetical protein